MASKKAAPTNEELLAQFDTITVEDNTTDQNPKTASGRLPSAIQQPSETDPLAELNNLVQERPKSRPHTPRIAPTPAAQSSPKQASAANPSSAASARTSEERATTQTRRSGDSTRSFHQSFTPGTEADDPEAVKHAEPAPEPKAQSTSSWWGGFVATASAAVKQAEALAKEIQQNEEAQRWAEQVKGNVGALRGLGGELRSRALPTFTNILHTLAPPISSHERLQIHITHDFIGYPSLDPLIYQTFSRVMAQVEGGDLMVIQRGQESSPRRGSEAGFTGSSLSGWSDGPWWRQSSEKRDLGAVNGLIEGTKLSKVSAESYANDYFAPKGGVEEAAKHAAEVLNENNPVRNSDIFLSIQAISQTLPPELFGGSAREENENGIAEPDDKSEALICFAIYLHDPIHGITFHTITQTMPQRWVDWLHSPSEPSESSSGLPQEIAEIINSGGVDPREWVAEWVEELLSLGVGVLAQKYVARRMGVGEGGIGRGKAREEVIEAGAGEAARAM
ncbi:hypothetical protein MMC11_005118 [Xylographa trunciseda]|nr:hypothetical protein [Xylographa trunciseda]